MTSPRTVTSDTSTFGVEGKSCVFNGGAVATENLTINLQLLKSTGAGGFQPEGGLVPATAEGVREAFRRAEERASGR